MPPGSNTKRNGNTPAMILGKSHFSSLRSGISFGLIGPVMVSEIIIQKIYFGINKYIVSFMETHGLLDNPTPTVTHPLHCTVSNPESEQCGER